MSFINQQTKNFFLLGWGLGVFGYTGYKINQSKQSTPISKELLKNSAIMSQATEFHYKFKNRQQHIEEVSEYKYDQQKDKEYDMVIIGGGASGSGVFLDASSRGLKCLLLENHDFAAGTSSKSTKLIHGGIRYLQQVFEFSMAGARKEKYDLVQEGLSERSYFLENAFYMNKSIPLVIPSTGIFSAAYLYLGTVVYHFIYLFSADDNCSVKFKFPMVIGKDQLKSQFKNLDDKYKYGIVYYDGQFNDSRMNIDLIMTGTIQDYIPGMKGGNALNYAQVTDILKDNNGKVNGVQFIDKISGKKYDIPTKSVVNCAGTFADQIRKMDNPNCGKRIVAVGGSHLVFPQNYGSKKYGLVIPETKDGRILFIVPWQNNQIVGTTEKSFDEPTVNPTVSFDEQVFMMDEMQNLYPKMATQDFSENVKSKWCGLRPLILNKEVQEGEKVDTKSIARKHVIERSQNNLFSLMGGKWTAYRTMAEETVDEVMGYLEKEKKIDMTNIQKEGQTKYLRLSGEFIKDKEFNYPAKREYGRFYSQILQEKYESLDKKQSKYMIKNYGDKAFDIMKICLENPKYEEKLVEGHPFIQAEIAYHIRSEMAVKPVDVIYRRTRLGFIDRRAIQEAIPTIVNIFAQELKWSNSQKQLVLDETKKLVNSYDF